MIGKIKHIRKVVFRQFQVSANIFSFSLLLMLAMHEASAQVTVFSDDFSTNTSATWTTSGAIGASAWSISRSGDDWGGRRNTSPLQLELTNDASATGNVNGYVLASTPTTSFLSPYSTTLNTGGAITWSFNMRQIRPDPGGFGATNSYGVAFILAGTANTTRTTGNGYAVVLGQPVTSLDSVRLVSYATGLSSAVNIISSNTTGLTDFGAEYLSIKITYNPCNSDQWEFFLRNDGTSGFADPLTGTLVSQGTASNSTYVGTSLPLLGAYWQGSTGANQTSFFDNVTVSAIKTSVAVGTNPTVCQGVTSATLAYTVQGAPDQYSIDYSAAANTAGFVDITDAVLPPSPIPLVVPAAAPLANYSAVLTVRNTTTGCVSPNTNFIVHVVSCTAPYLTWVPLPAGEVHAGCTSATVCTPASGNVVCYGLKYTPNHTGVLTSYTTGFLINCTTLGNPVVSSQSCVMTNNSPVADSCLHLSLVLANCSGNSGSLAVTQNVPVIIHQLCLAIPSSQSVDIAAFFTGTTSIDLAGGGFVSEDLGYSTYTASWDQECLTLPLRWLDFNASRYNDHMSLLDWTTADEINNSYFEIQRSNDNGRTFLTIGKVNAASGNESVNVYQFIDQTIRTGKNYYRLKQVDFDGRFDFSPIRTVTFTSGAFSVKAWPNPVTDDLNISIQYSNGAGHIILFDMSGQQILRKSFLGEDVFENLDVSTLNPGIYTLIVEDGNNRHIEKIVIMN